MDRIFANSAAVLLLLNCILYFRSFSTYGKAFKIFSFYLLSTLSIEFLMRIFAYYHYQNLVLSHFYFVFQFTFLSLFYFTILKEEIQKKIVKIYFVFCFSTLLIQYVFVPNKFFQFNLFEIFITCFPIIIFAILYLYNMLNEKKVFYLINIGVLIYTLGCTIIFLAGNIITIYNAQFARDCWTLNTILYLFYQILIFIEWRKNYSKLNFKTDEY